MSKGYIQTIREKVGSMPLILNAAGGILLNENEEVLLNLRTDSGNWSLPGGYMEYGESFDETVRREFKEDSGLDVEIVKHLAIFDKDETVYPNGDVVQIISSLYLVRRIGGDFSEADASESAELKFWPFDALPPIFNKQNKQMLDWTKERLDKGEL